MSENEAKAMLITRVVAEALARREAAERAGVRPTVRVVESFAIPPYWAEDPGPVCEDEVA